MKIQTYNKISDAGLRIFDNNFEIFDESNPCTDPDAIICRSYDLNKLYIENGNSFGKNLRAIARAGAGVNNIPVANLTQQGVVVFNSPGANANAVVELVIAALLQTARNLESVAAWKDKLQKPQSETELKELIEKEKKLFVGSELRHKTLSILGLGAIGSRLAYVASYMGMKINGYDPKVSNHTLEGLKALPNFSLYDNILSLLKDSPDFVSLHIPAIVQNTELFSFRLLEAMPAGSILLNFSRAEVVSTKDIAAALDRKHLKYYITDFIVPELLGRSDVLWYPHLGASTKESEDNCSEFACRSLYEYLMYGSIRNSVNFPEVVKSI